MASWSASVSHRGRRAFDPLHHLALPARQGDRPDRRSGLALAARDELRMHKLSDLKGKAVILDFTIYQSAVSPTHNYMLRDLYDI